MTETQGLRTLILSLKVANFHVLAYPVIDESVLNEYVDLLVKLLNQIKVLLKVQHQVFRPQLFATRPMLELMVGKVIGPDDVNI